MEENFVSNQMPHEPWYKTTAGIVTLVMVSLLMIVVLWFVGFFVYYSWQLRYGDAQDLAKQFNQKTEKTGDDKINLGTPISVWQKYVRSHNPQTGSANAKVVIVEFVDFGCPVCQATYPVLKSVAQRYEPVVRVVFKNLPFEQTHPGTKLAALAAVCANEQKSFWPYHDLILGGQSIEQEVLNGYVSQLGLNSNSFEECLTNETYLKEINQDLMDAAELNLKGTPSYLINGYKISGAIEENTWDKIIMQLLQDK